MFKNEEQVKTFIDKLEKFVLSVCVNNFSPDIADVIVLNKNREDLESFIKAISGITLAANTTDTLSCPDCGHDMALRTNRSNGNKFWGCKKYPECKGTRDENGLSKAEREEAKYKKEYPQDREFSFNRDKRDVVNEVSPSVDNAAWKNPFAK